MWPIVENRKKNRRYKSSGKRKNSDRRKKDRREIQNWIDLFLNDDDPYIS